MNRRLDFLKAMDIFHEMLSTHVINILSKKWGSDWREEIKPYAFDRKFGSDLKFDDKGTPLWDDSTLIRIFTNPDFREDFGFRGPHYKNWAYILRDARNDAAHNRPIPTDYLLAATFGMKTISKLFHDKTNFEQLSELYESFNNSEKNIDDSVDPSIEIVEKPEIAKPEVNKPVDNDKVSVNLVQKTIGPIKLLEVKEGTRGRNNARAILLRFNVEGNDKEIGCNFSDGYSERLLKCSGLVGKMVLVHWANDKFTFENGWFSDIEAYAPSSGVSQENAVPSSSGNKLLDEQANIMEHQIVSVELVSGDTLYPSWKHPMWKIQTNVGNYIAPASEVNSEEIKPGKIVRAKVTQSRGYEWLNILRSTLNLDLDDEIPF